MTALRAIPAALATFALAGCGGGHAVPPPAPPEQPASAAGRFRDQGVTVTVRAWNCGGVYGPWQVRVRIGGAARGEGEGEVTIRRGRETTYRSDFRIRVAGVPATAAVRLGIRVDGDELDVRGNASARALFVRVKAPIEERLPIRRGPIVECR